MKCYHGTSEENAKNIMKNGFQNANHNWHISNDDVAYFFTEGETEYNEVIEKTIWNGCIAAAIGNSKSEDIYIFEIELSDDEIQDMIDYSDGDKDVGSVEVPISLINERGFEVYKCKNAYIPSMKLMYLAQGCVDYMNMSSLTSIEKKLLVNQYMNNQLFVLAEELDAFRYDENMEYTLEKLKKEDYIMNNQTTIYDFL